MGKLEFTTAIFSLGLSEQKYAGGNKRREWQECAWEQIDPNETLRQSAQRWLRKKKIIPGTPVRPEESAFFHMRGAEGDGDTLCLASLVRGGRCSRKRTHGNYCKQHSHEMRKPEKKEALWESLDEPFSNAASRWEKEQVELALKLSWQENEELQEKREASRRKIQALLRPDGLEPVETQADGTCQCLAVLFSVGIALDACRFRQQVVDYLRTLPGEFAWKIDSEFGSFTVYCDTMNLPARWGDELTLTAMAHLLLRPIEVVSDCELEPRRVFEPPRFMCE